MNYLTGQKTLCPLAATWFNLDFHSHVVCACFLQEIPQTILCFRVKERSPMEPSYTRFHDPICDMSDLTRNFTSSK